MSISDSGTVIAAVKTSEEFFEAINSGIKVIFDLSPDLLTVSERAEIAHGAGKKILIHLDLASGIGKDKSGLKYAKKAGVDGIISTRANIIKTAKELDLFTIQRFFIVDSKSLDTAIETVNSIKPEMIEIMPGIAPKAISKIKETIKVPIIAGGLVETEEEVMMALKAGASAVSTGKNNLWSKVL